VARGEKEKPGLCERRAWIFIGCAWLFVTDKDIADVCAI
jgi:hypothetical protein